MPRACHICATSEQHASSPHLGSSVFLPPKTRTAPTVSARRSIQAITSVKSTSLQKNDRSRPCAHARRARLGSVERASTFVWARHLTASSSPTSLAQLAGSPSRHSSPDVALSFRLREAAPTCVCSRTATARLGSPAVWHRGWGARALAAGGGVGGWPLLPPIESAGGTMENGARPAAEAAQQSGGNALASTPGNPPPEKVRSRVGLCSGRCVMVPRLSHLRASRSPACPGSLSPARSLRCVLRCSVEACTCFTSRPPPPWCVIVVVPLSPPPHCSSSSGRQAPCRGSFPAGPRL
mmetsp:Transcript_12205/g.35858  ORF Transcript_12205/g.35858 Transcript_12205/m.35858 type:complete len:295 (+) Transcript_12205:1054-1938(+)